MTTLAYAIGVIGCVSLLWSLWIDKRALEHMDEAETHLVESRRILRKAQALNRMTDELIP